MMPRLVATVVVTLLAPHPGASQSADLADAVKATISDEALDRHAREITSRPRPSGSPGENAAIDYVATTLRAAGVPVEVHEFRVYVSDPVEATVEVPGTDFSPEAITMSFSGATPGVAGELLDLGSLQDLPGLEVGTGERLAVRDPERWEHVRGRVVLVTGQPRNVPTAVLEGLGAAAVVFVNPEERLNELIVTSTWGTPSLLSAHRLPTLPTAQVRWSDGERLRAMLAEGPVRVRVRTEVEQGWRTLRLAVARVLPPGDPDAPYVLFGGHIDGWHHGATDEGASNAAMLELALAFHAHREELRRGLVVAWWPGHSNARYGGSTWFADRFFQELLERGRAYVNVDGIGQTGARRFSVSTSPALRGLATRVVARAADGTPGQGRPGRNSDQAFNGVGLPLLQINHTRLQEDGGYWWWHTPDDTYDKIDLDVLRTDTDLYADALAALLAEPVPPLDLGAEVDALREALDRRGRESGGRLDLDAARAAVDGLDATVARLEGLLAGGGGGPADLEPRLYDVLRPLHRVMFVPGSDHHPDPGLYGSPLPGLEPASILAEEPPASDRAGFARAYLVREVNRVLEALRESRRAASDLVRLLTRP